MSYEIKNLKKSVAVFCLAMILRNVGQSVLSQNDLKNMSHCSTVTPITNGQILCKLNYIHNEAITNNTEDNTEEVSKKISLKDKIRNKFKNIFSRKKKVSDNNITE